MSNLTDKWKNLKKWQKAAIIIGVLALIGQFIPDPLEDPTYIAEKAKQDSTKAVNDSLKSAVEADRALLRAKKDSLITCYIHAKNLLIESMNDPKSFDELDSKYYFLNEKTEEGGVIQVLIEYTGKNGFGGTVRSKQVFHYDKNMYLVKTFDI